MKQFILTFGLLLSVFYSYSQTNNQQQYNDAYYLYKQRAYQAARLKFAQITGLDYTIDKQYYIAASAIKAQQKDGRMLMQQFVQRYPRHILAHTAYLDMADYYFSQAKYDKALKNYKQSESTLSYTSQFKKGYSAFEQELFGEALEIFEVLNGTSTAEEIDAGYFQGFVYYANNEEEKAVSYLQKALASDQYQLPALELYSSILFKKNAYKTLIDTVEKYHTPITNGRILNLVADARYILKNYRLATLDYVELLSQHSKHRNGKTYFRAGYSYYIISKLPEAEKYLKQAAVADDSVGAYASYYLGVIYSQQNNLSFAISSFENTAKYNTKLKEFALYYQSVTMMQQANFETVIPILTAYKTQYPQGQFYTQVHEMMSAAYAQTDNYDLAIVHIEALNHLIQPLKATYQRVSYLKGVLLFNDKKIKQSITYFKKSLIYNMDREMVQYAYYWIGEGLSLLDKFDESTFYYNSISEDDDRQLFLKAKYGLGYAHYNMRQYQEAVTQFQLFESKYFSVVNVKYLKDVLLRIGDCFFAIKNYNDGIGYYQKALDIGSKEKGYLYFQIGLLNRYLSRNIQAESYFNRLIKEVPWSPSVDHAKFQIAQMAFEDGESKKAAEAFEKFITSHPQSNFVPYAMLNWAVSLDNLGDEQGCISRYKEILERFARHKVANSALLGLQNKHSSGDFDGFESYLEMYKQANPNSEALENIEFETAQAYFYEQNYDDAISKFRAFKATYPHSALLDDVQFFIGDAYYRLKQYPQALEVFEPLAGITDFTKHTKVLYRIANMTYQLGNNKKSILYYYRLAQASNSRKNIVNYQNGLMENYYAIHQYDSASRYANLLLDNPRTDALISARTNLILGIIAYHEQSFDEGLKYLLTLVSQVPNENGAEAYYYISLIYKAQMQHETALESLFVLTNNFQSYESWLGKAYLLMAAIYIETEEIFQAKATLRSLIEHSTIASIKASAMERLESIENLNNNTNGNGEDKD